MTRVAEIVRSSRQNAGLTQNELSRRARVPQPSISSIETGDRNPNLDLVDRLLAPTGRHLAVLPTRTPTVAESAATIHDLLDAGEDPYVFRALIQVANDLAEAEPALRVALAVTPPSPTGSEGADAFLAAIVEYRLTPDSLPCPEWIHDQSRVLDQEWIVSGLTQLADITREGTPEPFLRRGVLIEESDLVSY